MATIKSHTDLSQSKKLEEILPFESADYTCLGKDKDNVLYTNIKSKIVEDLKQAMKDE